MYYYIVNPSSGNGSFADIQHRLKARVRELDIDGEFAKTLDTGDAEKITRSVLKRGAKTIVVAGGDQTVNEVLSTVNSLGRHSVAVGIIPLGEANTVASHLGIGDWQHACEVLAARRLQPFNVIHVNDYSFIHSCVITSAEQQAPRSALAEIDGQYKLRGQVEAATVRNQKLLNVHLPNQLVVHLEGSAEAPAWWRRWLPAAGPAPAATQLHARVVILEFDGQQTATIDGRTFNDNLFRIRLAETPVKLIAAKTDQQGFDS